MDMKNFIKAERIVIYDENTSIDNILTLRLVRFRNTNEIVDELIEKYLSNMEILSVDYEKDFIVIMAKFNYGEDKEVLKVIKEMRLYNMMTNLKKLLLEFNLLNKDCISIYNELHFNIKFKDKEFYNIPEDTEDWTHLIKDSGRSTKFDTFIKELEHILYFQESLTSPYTFNRDNDNYLYFSSHTLLTSISLKPIIEEYFHKELLKELKIINLINLGIKEFEPVFDVNGIRIEELEHRMSVKKIMIPLTYYAPDLGQGEYKLFSENNFIDKSVPKLEGTYKQYIDRLREVEDNNWRLNVIYDLDDNMFYLIIRPDNDFLELYEKEFKFEIRKVMK